MQLITTIQETTGELIGSIQSTTSELRSQGGFTLIVQTLAVLGALVFLLPLHAGLMTSIKTISEFAQSLPMAPPGPGGFTLSPWAAALDILGPSMINSFAFTIPAMVFSAVLGSLAAYGLTMVDWRGQVGVMAIFVAATFLPKQAIVVPLSRFWSIVDIHAILANLGPINIWALPYIQDYHATIIELIITHSAYGISICALLFRGYYLTIDQELMEAARLDGASIFQIYREIVVPLSYPMFAVVLIFQFTTIWNEFFYGLIISAGGQAAPVTVALNDLNSGYAQLYNRQTAGAFIVALPTLIVYLLFGDKFAEGVK